MRRLNRTLLAVAFCMVAAQAFSMDFGSTIGDSTTLSGTSSGINLTQKNTASAWISDKIDEFSSLYISVVYQFYGNFLLSPELGVDSLRPYQFTAGRIEWEGFKSLGPESSLRWSLGRVPFQDYSGRVVNGVFDGGLVEMSFGSIQVRAAVALSGLIFKEDALVIIDNDDIDILFDDTRNFAPRRLLSSVSTRFIEMVPMLDIGFDAWAQFDVEDGDTTTHTQYLEPFIEGRVGRELRWRLWGVGQLGQEDGEFFYSAAAGGRVGYSLPELLGFNLSASALWAAGDYGGSMRRFLPINAASIATITGTTFSDAMSLALDGSIAPSSALSAGAGAAVILIPGQAGSAYEGTEATARVSYAPYNDLNTTLQGGVFLPNTSNGAGSSMYWSVSLGATLKL